MNKKIQWNSIGFLLLTTVCPDFSLSYFETWSTWTTNPCLHYCIVCIRLSKEVWEICTILWRGTIRSRKGKITIRSSTKWDTKHWGLCSRYSICIDCIELELTRESSRTTWWSCICKRSMHLRNTYWWSSRCNNWHITIFTEDSRSKYWSFCPSCSRKDSTPRWCTASIDTVSWRWIDVTILYIELIDTRRCSSRSYWYNSSKVSTHGSSFPKICC